MKSRNELKRTPSCIIAIVAILLAANLATTDNVFAQGPPEGAGPPYNMGEGGHGMGKGGRGGGPMKGLFEMLDEDQKEKVKAILEDHREDAEATQENMAAKHEELRELIKADAAEATVLAKADEIGKIKNELFKSKISMQLEIRALLTEEQKDELDKAMDEMGPGGPGGKHGKGGPHKGGPPKWK
jgi:Spy/CpxP family protein refolding chaperone